VLRDLLEMSNVDVLVRQVAKHLLRALHRTQYIHTRSRSLAQQQQAGHKISLQFRIELCLLAIKSTLMASVAGQQHMVC